MPLSVPNTTATTDFVTVGGGSNYGGGWIMVFNGFVEVRLLHGTVQGQVSEGPVYVLPAGITPISAGGRPDIIAGFEIRALDGVLSSPPQQYMAALWEPGMAGLTPSTPFPASINSSGTTNPCPCGSGGGGSLDVTDGVTDVNPTAEIFVADGLALTNPSPGVAHLATVPLDVTDGSTDVARTTKISVGSGINLTNPNPGEAHLDVAASAYVLLASKTLLVDGPIDFTGLSGAYSDLIIAGKLRALNATGVQLRMRLNGDSGNDYASTLVNFNGTSVATNEENTPQTSMHCGNLNLSGSTAGDWSPVELTIAGYSSTTWQKNVVGTVGQPEVLTTGGRTLYQCLCTWNQTAAVNRVTIFGNTGTDYVAGSQIKIYGRV